ncbi:hypothetical protein BV511_24900 [Methylorubrum extorquens]|nr:hypothetical protein BV511_24900 [Methylorubrum extorquens]
MAKVSRAREADQGWLLPPSRHGVRAAGHTAQFGRDTVREALDLSARLDTEERGYPDVSGLACHTTAGTVVRTSP